jgi:GNAT superfamily N-acetyltransferase
VELRSLREGDDRSQFTCGDLALDDFFRSRAGQSQFRHRASVTYVLANADGILAFATVLPGTIRRDELGQGFKRLPPSALPVLILARMAVSSASQGLGLGARLLAHVFHLALDIVERVGCVGVIVDAKEAAVGFYEKYDFIWLAGSNAPGLKRGFLPIQTIERGRTLEL